MSTTTRLSTSMVHGKYTFVTVVYEAEFPLLVLQARSMAQFLPEPVVGEIIVIDNSVVGMSFEAVEALRGHYGPLAPLLRVMPGAQVVRMPRSVGWRSQQVLKLCVSRVVSTERYVVLDAKNHLVSPLGRDFLEAPDGRPFMNVYDYRNHPLRPSLIHVLNYLRVAPDDHVDQFAATVPPFIFCTQAVREMLDGLSAGRRSFPEEFVRNELTEFFLYVGWMLREGVDFRSMYQSRDGSFPYVWPRAAHSEGVAEAIDTAKRECVPVFGVHRRALTQLDERGANLLAQFWVDRGLFATQDRALKFMADFRRAERRLTRKQGIREFPQKVLVRTRRELNKRGDLVIRWRRKAKTTR